MCALGPEQWPPNTSPPKRSPKQPLQWSRTQELRKSQQLLDYTLHAVLASLCSPWKGAKNKAPNPRRCFHNSPRAGGDVKPWLPLGSALASSQSSLWSDCTRLFVPLLPRSGTTGSVEVPSVTQTPLRRSENFSAAGELKGKDTTCNGSAAGSCHVGANKCKSCWGKGRPRSSCLASARPQRMGRLMNTGLKHLASIPTV